MPGKSHRQKLRHLGEIPGIVYARGKVGTRVALNQKSLEYLLAVHGPGGLFSLAVDDDQPVLAVVRELQRNPVNKHIIHVDFLRVDATEEIEAAVAVQIKGEEELREKGGFLQLGAREVLVKCLPESLPDMLPIDASQLTPGQQITAEKLTLPSGVHLAVDPALVIASVLADRQTEEPEPIQKRDDEDK